MVEARDSPVRGLAYIRRIWEGHDMAQLAEDFKIIDADTHYTEPYDLWTSRAPKGYENRVLHMEERAMVWQRGSSTETRSGSPAEAVSSHETVRSSPS